MDLLVIMPARSMIDQAVRIRLAFNTPFPMDLLVYTPDYLAERLRRGDQFTREVLEQGVVFHDTANP